MSESLNSPNIFELKEEVQKFVHGFLSENTVFKRGEVKNTEVENTEVCREYSFQERGGKLFPRFRRRSPIPRDLLIPRLTTQCRK